MVSGDEISSKSCTLKGNEKNGSASVSGFWVLIIRFG
jgi:hypothetical protein